ncbi:hypothetical protein B9Z55_017934 [Caenorhabditis nigoni]|uniref:Uncharacterized protein n=1 Tax=Caenorhabditis nigoni TaxID=1611254 RepID=A0A2G5TBT3_9PELO|nr:hypothetical protein B9Z55_017934 [Caenorhabditis nigoni]
MKNQTASLFVLNDDSEILLAGIIYFIMSSFFAPVFYIFMKIIYNRDSQSPNITNKLMNLIMFLQLTQGMIHFLTSPVLIFPNMLTEFSRIITTQSIQTSAKSRKNELAILLQFTFIIIYTSFVVIMWHPILIPMMSFIDMNKTRNQAIMNGLWIFDSYVNPIMMLIFNKSIRDDVFIMLKSGGKKNISPVTVTAFSHGPN